ncbi:MAG TPA: PTS sugar transporter subunit IIC [Clostridiales bacterium]|nr:PTS sugar transporter subunit IIC [Clostridiales bacterium]
MKKVTDYLNRLFIDGLSGMALGLFSTLIIGTIIQQIGKFIGGDIGTYFIACGKIASSLTGAGIGCGVAFKLSNNPLIVISAATSGMVGAFAASIINGKFLLESGAVQYLGPGEPLGAFIAAYIGIEIGILISGKTKMDIVLVPLLSISAGATTGLLLSPHISQFISKIGLMIEFGTNQRPILMGIIVAVLMGMLLTLPISSAAIALSLGLTGLSAGAATAGCCANMIGFAIASYKENKFGGLLAQGLGTSMLQISNIYKHPIIWLPAIISSAILGPLSTTLFKMTNNAVGAGMGTAGLVGQIMTYETMVAVEEPLIVLIKILLLHFILPGILSYSISQFMRKKGFIKSGSMKLEV